MLGKPYKIQAGDGGTCDELAFYQRGIKILSRGFMVPKMKSSGDSFAHPICSLGKDLTLKSKKNLSSIF